MNFADRALATAARPSPRERSGGIGAQARDLGAQRRERQPRVADQRDLGWIVGADHRRIDVDVDHAHLARRRMAPALGDNRSRPAADEDHEVRPIDQLPGRRRAAVAADHAERQRVVRRDGALPADRGRDRRFEQFRQRRELVLGAGDHRSAAADQERVRRRQKRLGGRRDRGLVGRRAPCGKDAERGVGMDVGLVHGTVLDVERQADVHRTGAAGGHVAERGAHRRRDLGCAVEHPVPLGQRAEQRFLVELGQHVAAARADRDVAGHGEQRDRGLVRLDHARQEVGGAAARWPLAHADPPGDPRVGVGHVGGRALVAGQDVADAVVEAVERIVERQAGVAAQAEDVAHAVQLQHAHERLGPGQLGHDGFPPRWPKS